MTGASICTHISFSYEATPVADFARRQTRYPRSCWHLLNFSFRKPTVSRAQSLIFQWLVPLNFIGCAKLKRMDQVGIEPTLPCSPGQCATITPPDHPALNFTQRYTFVCPVNQPQPSTLFLVAMRDLIDPLQRPQVGKGRGVLVFHTCFYLHNARSFFRSAAEATSEGKAWCCKSGL